MFRSLYILTGFILLVTILFALFWVIRAGLRQWRQHELPRKNSLSSDFERFAQHTKWKRWGATAALVLILFSAIYFVGYRLNAIEMEKAFWKTNTAATHYFETQAPGIDYNNLIVDQYGTFSSNLHADTYKEIDGYRVAWQPFNQSFGTLANEGYNYQSASSVLDRNAWYTQGTNQKIATFFSTKLNYQSKNFFGVTPTQDIKHLTERSNTVAELAVTFDKPYTYTEIQKMIPSNLLISWYWIGYAQPNNLDTAQQTDYFGLTSDDTSGSLSAASYNEFTKAVKTSAQESSSQIGSFNSQKDALRQVQKYSKLSKAKFSGVLLTGQAKNFAALAHKSWIFASNFGLITTIRSDIQPIK